MFLGHVVVHLIDIVIFLYPLYHFIDVLFLFGCYFCCRHGKALHVCTNRFYAFVFQRFLHVTKIFKGSIYEDFSFVFVNCLPGQNLSIPNSALQIPIPFCKNENTGFPFKHKASLRFSRTRDPGFGEIWPDMWPQSG